MSFVRSLLAAIIVLVVAMDASAQFSPLPGTGCPNGGSITTAGAPRLGMTVTYTWFCPARTDTPFMLFGPSVPAIVPLPLWISCVKACLLIHPAPPILLSGPAGLGLRIPLSIPTDASLVGQTFHTQGGCVSTAPCIFLGVGLAPRIQ